jgi:hypothetical protein
MFRRIGGALIALGLASVPAASQPIEYVYTKFDEKTCKHNPSREVEDYGSWLCPGHDGIPVRLSAGDQRMFVTYGNWKKGDLASSQTFPGFNSVYEGTVEWRIEKKSDGKARPFATILRWNLVTARDSENATGPITSTGRVLVVTRLGPGGVCHVGYVDARANPDANELARKIADEHARTFKCGKDQRIVLGKPGDVVMPRGSD